MDRRRYSRNQGAAGRIMALSLDENSGPPGSRDDRLRSYLKWLYPGMHVKRWLVLLLFGITFIALGVAYFLTNVYRTQPFPEWTYYVTLQFIPRAVRGLIFVLIGVGTIGTALVQLNRSLLSPFRTAGQRGRNVRRRRARGRLPRRAACGDRRVHRQLGRLHLRPRLAAPPSAPL